MARNISSALGLSSLFLAACTASPPPWIEAKAIEVASSPVRQVLVEATLTPDSGEDIIMPRIIVIEGQRATAFVGDTIGEAKVDGYTIDVDCEGDWVILDLKRHEGGVVLSTQKAGVRIQPMK